MRGIIKALVRWPMYSIPRLMLTLVALVGLGLALNALSGNEGGQQSPAATSSAAAASDGGGATADDAAQAEKVASGALREFVGRGSPTSESWQRTMTYYATPELIESLSKQKWAPAAAAPLYVENVAVADRASDGGVNTPTKWAHVMAVKATTKEKKSLTLRFRVVAEKSGGEWTVTELEAVR